MISSLRGTLAERNDDGIVLDVGGVGYDVVLPPVVAQSLGDTAIGGAVTLRIAYVATRDQPSPVLYGFRTEPERQFWGLLRSVPRVGPRGACRAMVLPINRIAEAISSQNTRLVDSLPGVSAQGAEKIIAALRNKVAAFLDAADASTAPEPESADDLQRLAVELLVDMGIRRPDAVRDVARLAKARPELTTVEDLVMEYFRK
jgi:Holliday junction DNA helicase RuvA